MGEQKVTLAQNDKNLHQFIKNLIKDIQALEHMLDHEMFENNIKRIGAEQEMCIVQKKNYKPALICMEVIEKLGASLKNYMGNPS